MNKQDYEKYHQTGGSYIIPVEIFNELFDDYECFKNDCKKYKEVIDKIRKEMKGEYSIMGVKVVENDTLEDILKEVE